MLSVFIARLILGCKILWNDTNFLERELRRWKIALSKEIYKKGWMQLIELTYSLIRFRLGRSLEPLRQ